MYQVKVLTYAKHVLFIKRIKYYLHAWKTMTHNSQEDNSFTGNIQGFLCISELSYKRVKKKLINPYTSHP